MCQYEEKDSKIEQSNKIYTLRKRNVSVASSWRYCYSTCRAGSAQMRGIGSGILFWFTVRGRMVRDGRVFYGHPGQEATTSHRPGTGNSFKDDVAARSAPLLCRMGRAFLSVTVMGEP